jgi:hypothetical protein
MKGVVPFYDLIVCDQHTQSLGKVTTNVCEGRGKQGGSRYSLGVGHIEKKTTEMICPQNNTRYNQRLYPDLTNPVPVRSLILCPSAYSDPIGDPPSWNKRIYS